MEVKTCRIYYEYYVVGVMVMIVVITVVDGVMVLVVVS